MSYRLEIHKAAKNGRTTGVSIIICDAVVLVVGPFGCRAAVADDASRDRDQRDKLLERKAHFWPPYSTTIYQMS
jgi:hypothetical protein